MGALLPFLLPAIPGLINLVEAAFAKPKSGTDKMNAVIQALQAVISTLVGSGQAPASVPPSSGIPAASLQGIVETKLSEMKGNGTLTQPGVPPTTALQQLYLVQGTVSALKSA